MKTYWFALGLLVAVASASPAAAQPRRYVGDHAGYFAPRPYAHRYAPRRVHRYYGPRVAVVVPPRRFVRPLPPPPVRVWVPGYWQVGPYGRRWIGGYWVWR